MLPHGKRPDFAKAQSGLRSGYLANAPRTNSRIRFPMNAPISHPIPPYRHTPLFPLGEDKTPYRKLTVTTADGMPLPGDGVRVEKILGRDVLVIEREAIRALAEAAFTDINHLLRPGHLKQLRSILDD